MEHPEAIRLIEVAADGRIAPTERAALEQHLATCAECQAYATELATLEGQLRHSLQAGYPDRGADAMTTSVALGRISTRLRRQSMFQTIYRTAAWTAVAALFVLAIGWSIRNLLPSPVALGVPTTALEGTALQQETFTPAPVTPGPTQSTQSLPLPGGTSPLFPNAQFELQAALPASPGQVAVYVQQLPEPITLEGIRQMASGLGLEAPIYQRPGEGSEPIYIVTDGFRTLTFVGGAAEIFVYVADTGQVPTKNRAAPSFEQAVEAAQAYLDEHSLADPPLRAAPLLNEPGGVSFTRTLDDHPVIFGLGNSPSLGLDVIVGPDGNIRQVSYAPFRVQGAGQFPILSAEEAWNRFLSGAAMDRLRYGVSDVPTPGTYQSWQREYPAGEPAHLYGYASTLQPAEPGGAPLAMFNNWLVIGPRAAEFAATLSPYNFWHAWGQFQADEQGRLAFHIEGWEVSPFEDKYLQGKVRRDGDRAWLVTDEGDFELPKLLSDVPAEVFTEARGVFATPGVLEWWLINTGIPASPGYNMTEACMGGGGGGGGNDIGGGTFRPVSLQPVDTLATPATTPKTPPYSRVGDAVDGATGTVHVRQFISTSGETRFDYYFSGDPVGSIPSWAAHLTGDSAQELRALNTLPMRVWGTVGGLNEDGWPEIEVERFEEVYPGLRIQAWLGKWQPVSLEGKEALLFSTLEGEQFVLSSSIDSGSMSAVGLEGDRVLIEGLAIPGDTFGGYAVITEFSSSIANDRTDLSGYEITSNRAEIIDENYSETAQAADVQGTGKVEKVELVYTTASLMGCRGMGLTENDPQVAPWTIVQPVWRFTGTFENGRPFEIQIQALAEEYLR